MNAHERLALADGVVARSRADATEAIVYEQHEGLTRFAHEAVHQNLDRRNTVVRVRAISGSRTGVATTDVLDPAALDACAERAFALAAFAPEDPMFAGLAEPEAYADPPGAFVAGTAAAGPQERAGVAGAIFDIARENGVWSAGYAATRTTGIAIANSAGVRAAYDATTAACNVKLSAADASGYAECFSTDVGDVDGRALARIAAQKARASAGPVTVEPGAWTVILEPAAFGELMSYLLVHFSARAFDEGSSFCSAGLDRSYAGDNVTLVDDAHHPLHAGQPFDYEGTPTRRVPLLDAGTARAIVTDRRWAAKLDRENTGHALPAPNSYGPQVMHPVVEAGTKSTEQLIAETERGLLVTRFWYIRPVDVRQTLVTGMTRDGTFLIENGKLAGGVRNMRFNQSILEALAHCEFSSELRRSGGYSYTIVAPTAKIERFTFSSGTDF